MSNSLATATTTTKRSDTAAWPDRQAVAAALDLALTSSRPVERLAFDIAPIDPLVWLGAQPAGKRYFWQERDQDDSWAGVGHALVVDDPSRIPIIESDQSLGASARFFGGMRFDAARSVDAEWATFGASRFVLPRFELRRTKEGTRLAIHAIPGSDDAADVLDALDMLAPPVDIVGSVPAPVRRVDAPRRDEWIEAVSSTIGAIAADELEKVVLARRTSLGFDAPLDPIALVYRLRAIAERCFLFVVEPTPEAAFVGATPERLFRYRGDRVETEALAGSRPISSDPVDDALLRADLSESEKDFAEHEHVVTFLRSALNGSGASLERGPTTVVDLATNRHLYTPIAARLTSDLGPSSVLARLHPTPAVAGFPRDVAMQRIRATEPFDRGWYAGPVGWMANGEGEFAVAIRSGLVLQRERGADLHLFAGAGIVAGSVPEQEWREVDNKLADFEVVLGLREGTT